MPAWADHEKTCGSCGRAKRIRDWPRQPAGRLQDHCGCVEYGKFAALPETIKARTALAHAGDPLAVEWHIGRLEQKRQARERAARRAGKQYRSIDQVRAAKAPAQIKPSRLPKHEAHVVEWRRFKDALDFRVRYRNDPEFMLGERLRRQLRKKAEAVPGLQDIIGAAIKNGGESCTVQSVLGYSMWQLRAHLERQFVKGMDWDSWGRHGWHIDHILPRKCFDIATIEGVQAYWSLSNLRPLPWRDNLRKRDKVESLC